MNLTTILKPSCVRLPLENKEKTAAITELVDLLNANGLLIDRDEALESVLLREKTRSTGIGSGIAIPHGTCKAVKELVMAIGISSEPIDFESVDNNPACISAGPDRAAYSGPCENQQINAGRSIQTVAGRCRHGRRGLRAVEQKGQRIVPGWLSSRFKPSKTNFNFLPKDSSNR